MVFTIYCPDRHLSYVTRTKYINLCSSFPNGGYYALVAVSTGDHPIRHNLTIIILPAASIWNVTSIWFEGAFFFFFKVIWPGPNSRNFLPSLPEGCLCICNLNEIGPVVSEKKSFQYINGTSVYHLSKLTKWPWPLEFTGIEVDWMSIAKSTIATQECICFNFSFSDA